MIKYLTSCLAIKTISLSVALGAVSFDDLDLGYARLDEETGKVTIPHLYRIDPAFEKLNLNDSLSLLIERIAKFDPVKANDWKKYIPEVWKKGKLIKGISISPKECERTCLPLVKAHDERVFHFRPNKSLIISEDIYSKLTGHEKAIIQLQAFLINRAVNENSDLYKLANAAPGRMSSYHNRFELYSSIKKYALFFFRSEMDNYNSYLELINDFKRFVGEEDEFQIEDKFYYPSSVEFYNETHSLRNGLLTAPIYLSLKDRVAPILVDYIEFYKNGLTRSLVPNPSETYIFKDLHDLYTKTLLELNEDGSVHGLEYEFRCSEEQIKNGDIVKCILKPETREPIILPTVSFGLKIFRAHYYKTKFYFNESHAVYKSCSLSYNYLRPLPDAENCHAE